MALPIVQPDFAGTEPAAPSDRFREGAASGLRGIARMAADSRDALDVNNVDYNWLPCRSVLNWVDGSRAKFEWSINPYRGCEFGCVYCYARYTHEFMELRDPMDFERRIYMKEAIAEKLTRELERGKVEPGQTIAIGAATDPYQPAEKRFRLTRSVLDVLAKFSGFRVGVITKSDLILRDADVWRRLTKRHGVSVRITVTTTDAALARITEPRAVTPRRRLDAVKRLNDLGIPTGINLMPVLPGINDDLERLESVFAAAREAGAQFVGTQTLFLTSCSKRRYDAFIAEHFPHLTKLYEEFYRDGTDAPEFYQRDLKRKLKGLREKYGFSEKRDISEAIPPEWVQQPEFLKVA